MYGHRDLGVCYPNPPDTTTRENPRLWRVDHPYYCEERTPETYPSWEDFVGAYSDTDLNLLFRFDWETRSDGRNILKLFFILQRKGIYRSVEVNVRKANEPVIAEWLKVRYNKMVELWEGVTE